MQQKCRSAEGKSGLGNGPGLARNLLRRAASDLPGISGRDDSDSDRRGNTAMAGQGRNPVYFSISLCRSAPGVQKTPSKKGKLGFLLEIFTDEDSWADWMEQLRRPYTHAEAG